MEVMRPHIAPSAQRLAREVLLKIYEAGLSEVFDSGERMDKLFNQLLFMEDSASVIHAHSANQ